MKKDFAPLFIALVLLTLAVLVWPTRYKYDHLKIREADYPVRIDRFTGKAEILYPSGWSTSKTSERQQLPEEQMAKLKGDATLSSSGLMELQIYNGTQWTVSEITVLVTLEGSPSSSPIEDFDHQITDNNRITSRPYRLVAEFGVEPLSSGRFRADLGFRLMPGQTWTFKIANAKGQP